MFMDMAEAEMGSGSRSGIFVSNTWKERRSYGVRRFGVPAFKSTIHPHETREVKRWSLTCRSSSNLKQNYPSSLIHIDLRYSVTPKFSLNSFIVLLSNPTHGYQNMESSYLYFVVYHLASLYQNIYIYELDSTTPWRYSPASTARVVPVMWCAVLSFQ